MTTDAVIDARRHAFAGVPFTRLLGMRREYSEGGRARFVIDARPELENVIGAMHGGIVATLLDVAMASAAVSKVDFEMTAVTLSMNSTFVRPGHGRLTADGEVLVVDDAVALCQASVIDEGGRLVARAIGSFRYLPHR
ncbi:MAG TPA: PaaI family thioesterase [Burkholderiaceae bacterium]